MTTGKTIALTRQTFVNKAMSLLFNMLSGLVIAFLPRSKCLLISWLQSPSAVILELFFINIWAFLVAQAVKHLPAMWETCVWSLGQEDPLEKEMETHSRTLAWKIPWTEEPGRLQSMGSQGVGHNWDTSLTFINLYVWVSEFGTTDIWASITLCLGRLSCACRMFSRIFNCSLLHTNVTLPALFPKRVSTENFSIHCQMPSSWEGHCSSFAAQRFSQLLI